MVFPRHRDIRLHHDGLSSRKGKLFTHFLFNFDGRSTFKFCHVERPTLFSYLFANLKDYETLYEVFVILLLYIL